MHHPYPDILGSLEISNYVSQSVGTLLLITAFGIVELILELYAHCLYNYRPRHRMV
jgi:hypothetical protein